MELPNTPCSGAGASATRSGPSDRQLERMVDAWIEGDRAQALLLGEVLRQVAVLVDHLQDTFTSPPLLQPPAASVEGSPDVASTLMRPISTSSRGVRPECRGLTLAPNNLLVSALRYFPSSSSASREDSSESSN